MGSQEHEHSETSPTTCMHEDAKHMHLVLHGIVADLVVAEDQLIANDPLQQVPEFLHIAGEVEAQGNIDEA